MTKKTIILRNIIGFILILWGASAFFITIWNIKTTLELLAKHFDLTVEQISIYKVIKHQHLRTLLPLLSFFSGITLILNKRIGWITAIISTVLTGINVIKTLFTIEPSNYYIVAASVSIFFFSCCALLFTKPFLNKYNPNKTTFFIIGMVVTLVILDLILVK